MRNPQRTITLVPPLTRIQRNIHTRGARATESGTRTHVLAVPPTPIAGPSCHITRPSESATEGRKALADGITHAHAAEALELHVGGFLIGQQRIGHESVSVEDGVVAAHASMIGESCKEGTR